MSMAYQRRWIIADLRDRYQVWAIAKRRGVSEAYVLAVWSEWSTEKKRKSNSRAERRRRLELKLKRI